MLGSFWVKIVPHGALFGKTFHVAPHGALSSWTFVQKMQVMLAIANMAHSSRNAGHQEEFGRHLIRAFAC